MNRRLTIRQKQVLASYVRRGSFRMVGDDLGIKEQTVKNHMTGIRARLEVGSMMDVYVFLGWLVVPDDL